MSIASRTVEQRGDRAPVARDDVWVVEELERHSASMMALARRHSLCADDAQEAYQRTAEIFLRRAASVAPETVGGWLRTVIKHESMAVRAQRVALVGEDEGALEAAAPAVEDAAERVERLEYLSTAAEALERLKPQEVRALVMLAEGHTYKEISAVTGWTYTKVNRCVTEGRRAFRERVAAIETGEECERWAPALSALADGEAPLRQLMLLRPHLRRCPACRATLRAYRETPARVAALATPVAVGVPAALGSSGLIARLHDALASGVHERVLGSIHRAQALAETASTGKLAAVAASTVALAGGGYAAGVRLVAPVHHPHRTHVHRVVAKSASPRAATPSGSPSGGTSSSSAARSVGGGSGGTGASRPEPPAARRARVASAEFTPEGAGSATATRHTAANGTRTRARTNAPRASSGSTTVHATPAHVASTAHRTSSTSGSAATGEFGP